MVEPTPGPWEVRYSIAGPIAEVVDSTGMVICEMVLPAGGIPVSDANGHRIAAAPDLLEALEEFMGNWGSIYPGDMTTAVKLGRAAIAKAKGEE